MFIFILLINNFQEGLFLQSGVQKEMEIIRECLDTGESFSPHNILLVVIDFPPSYYSILFYSILFYSILFYSISILFYSILFYSVLFCSILFFDVVFFLIGL